MQKLLRVTKSLFGIPLCLFLTTILSSNLAQAQCPVANSCTPGSAPTSVFPFGMGIYSVTVGGATGFTNATSLGASDGYKDYSCTKKATVKEGVSTTISVSTNVNSDENVRVWVDLNNNGTFEAASELVFTSNNARQHTGTFTIPVSAAVVKNTVLRMRVSADDNGSPIPTPCSTPKFSQVEDYGITVQANTSKPTVDFTVNNPITCSPTVQFTELTQNGATSFEWSFGDNTKSTAANPTHTYANPGTYTVKLKACNAIGCDSITKTNYVTYHNNVPIAAACTPATLNYCCGYGITKITFGSLVNSSQDGAAGYENFTCTKSVTLEEGVQYPISFLTNPSNPQDTWVYIDYNNNGIFETTELAFSKLSSINPSGNIIIQGGGVRNTALRMRVVSDAQGATAGACVNRTSGQVEDYTIIITPNTRKPAVAFTSNFATSCDTLVQFTDQSLNAPTSWSWNFGDGSAISTTQNPLHKYTTNGVYTVKLIACNANGCDSLIKTNYITITKPCLQYCATINNNSTGVWISNVTLNTINNTSASNSSGYGNYTSISTSLTKGNTYALSVASNIGFNRTTSVWIDYNQDGDFNDSGEQVAFGQTATTYVKNLVISNSAKTGATRMRVMMRSGFVTSLTPCLSNQFQMEVEDYTVIIQPNTQPPVSAFATSSPTSCSFTVAFADTSSNSPTSWEWDFGDAASGANNTSTSQNPTHVFTGTGVYTVNLKVCNAYGCNTLTKTNYVTVTGNTGPVSPSCRPVSTAPCCGLGIFNVTLNTLNNTTSGSDGYQDYSCSKQTTLTLGISQPVSVRNGTSTNENVRIWIDYNNDGSFNPTTELAFSSDNKLLHTGNIVPAATAVLNTPLRMRVSSDYNQNPAPTPCSPVQYSQVEDYTVTIIPNTNVPVANFTAALASTCSNIANFTDISTFGPTSWTWTFGDAASGSNNTSTLQNPSHTFSGPGTYTVTLVACNSNGCNTITKTNIVTINSTINLAAACKPVTTAYCCGLGITNVTFGSINNTSADGSEGYKDFSCVATATVLQGLTYTLNVTTGTISNENVAAWIDFNNDGTFSASEQVMSSLNQKTHTATVTIPTSAVLNNWLRLRVSSDYSGNAVPQPCTNVQYGQAEDYAIKIVPNTNVPVANFTAALVSSCSNTADFTDNSTFGPTSWTWTFGDAASGSSNTSTLQNPSHTFSGPGTYSVTLVACNSNGCNTITKTNIVTINSTINLAAACKPATTAYCCGLGITNVTFGSINNTSADGSEGYKDFSCVANSTIIQGIPYTLNVTTGTISNENVAAWIDFNNDGTFATTERVMYSLNQKTHTATVTIPASAVLNTWLRLRVSSDYANNPAPQPCTNVQYGQFEDYAIKVVPNTNVPVANFTAALTSSCSNVANFTDNSTFGPTSWTWTFGDAASGSSNTSTLQNPSHTFSAAGTYTVTLVACNANGCNTITKTNVVTVSNVINLPVACKPITTANCCGVGITSVSFNSIANTSADGSEGYKDFSCVANTSVTAGATYT
jgi:PKD repeat protein